MANSETNSRVAKACSSDSRVGENSDFPQCCSVSTGKYVVTDLKRTEIS